MCYITALKVYTIIICMYSAANRAPPIRDEVMMFRRMHKQGFDEFQRIILRRLPLLTNTNSVGNCCFPLLDLHTCRRLDMVLRALVVESRQFWFCNLRNDFHMANGLSFEQSKCMQKQHILFLNLEAMDFPAFSSIIW